MAWERKIKGNWTIGLYTLGSVMDGLQQEAKEQDSKEPGSLFTQVNAGARGIIVPSPVPVIVSHGESRNVQGGLWFQALLLA